MRASGASVTAAAPSTQQADGDDDDNVKGTLPAVCSLTRWEDGNSAMVPIHDLAPCSVATGVYLLTPACIRHDLLLGMSLLQDHRRWRWNGHMPGRRAAAVLLPPSRCQLHAAAVTAGRRPPEPSVARHVPDRLYLCWSVDAICELHREEDGRTVLLVDTLEVSTAWCARLRSMGAGVAFAPAEGIVGERLPPAAAATVARKRHPLVSRLYGSDAIVLSTLPSWHSMDAGAAAAERLVMVPEVEEEQEQEEAMPVTQPTLPKNCSQVRSLRTAYGTTLLVMVLWQLLQGIVSLVGEHTDLELELSTTGTLVTSDTALYHMYQRYRLLRPYTAVLKLRVCNGPVSVFANLGTALLCAAGLRCQLCLLLSLVLVACTVSADAADILTAVVAIAPHLGLAYALRFVALSTCMTGVNALLGVGILNYYRKAARRPPGR